MLVFSAEGLFWRRFRKKNGTGTSPAFRYASDLRDLLEARLGFVWHS